MSQDSAQKELFTLKESEKGRKRGFKLFSIDKKNTISRRYFTATLSYENIVFFSVIFIMLGVAVFALGVERGKKLALKDRILLTDLIDNKKTARQDTVPESVDVPDIKDAQPYVPPAKIREEPKETVTVSDDKPYTVQLIAYKSEISANKEMEELKKEGYETFLIVRDGYYQICVGNFRNKEEAKSTIAALSKIYKDCFFRRKEKPE